MSFGRRLILFFLLIVVLPMAAVAGLLLQVTSESQTGKADARLAASLDTAIRLDGEQTARADSLSARLGKDRRLSAALRSGKPAQLQAAAEALAHNPGVVGIEIDGADGAQVAHAGNTDAVGWVTVQLQDPRGTLGSLRVSTSSAASFISRLAALTGRDAVLISNGKEIGGTVTLPVSDAPMVGQTKDLNLAGSDLRGRTVALADGTALVLLGPTEGAGLPINLRVAILLATLLAVALTLTFYLARTMHDLHELTSQQAVTDELTGLSNQRRFRELLAKEVERARRFGHPLSLLMLDLDDFKQVNDSHGHLQGDAVLRAVADAIKEESREVDEPARYGGEELAVALPETDAKGAGELAERIRARIEKIKVPLRGGRGSSSVTVSIGVAEMDGRGGDPDSLVSTADKALYEAKRAGKNQVRKAGARRRRAARRPRQKAAK